MGIFFRDLKESAAPEGIGYVLLESAKDKRLKYKKQKKTFKCPFCNERFNRYNLVFHIENKHEAMIPEGYTAGRVVFNYVNHKDSGRCIVCKMPTEWNEDVWKYQRLCGMKKCHDEYVATVKGRMVNTYGKEHLLNEPDQQNKMLKGRKISGKYKFQDGGVLDYVGQYEKNLLEFYDKVMNVKSTDLMSPGPTVEYEYNGEKHFWITDLYYIPANLAHDVKDGGDNPNNRPMPEYRAKQDAKEKAITNQGKYNYIRLTDNNFSQLMYILAEIKDQLMSVDGERDKGYTVVEINEGAIEEVGVSALAGALPPGNPCKDDNAIYMMPYAMTNIFDGGCLVAVKDNEGKCHSYKLSDEEDELEECSIGDVIGDNQYYVLEYVGDRNKYDVINTLMKQKSNGNDLKTIYESITNKILYDADQIFFDLNEFKSIDFNESERINEYNLANFKKELQEAVIGEYDIPLISKKDISDADYLLEGVSGISVMQNPNGYFLKNFKTNKVSPYVKSIQDFNKEDIRLIKNHNFE